MANELRTFTSASNHSGNPQDDYNKIKSGYPIETLKSEAKYILEEQSTGKYSLTKKPAGETVTSVDQPWDFIQDKEKVLIIRLSGVFYRFNFDWVSQFPAKFAPTFVVEFNMQSHGTAIDPQVVEVNKTAVQPDNPTAQGYTFGGWYTEAACTNAFVWTTKITQNITLYAKWTQDA